ncbi:AbrB family looped-hinge helix DNA binding protein [Rhizobium pisi]|uniref:AbrB family looped-hinge helix DNA binding protein n=1 Tax=Rhizobium pisi TaxID=574561 RepID=A0A3R9BJ21_9HYPH|nr:AbrB/MazE/SpoVT family DNA-binding domain-containing protein [Rhizobium pisi]MBB3136531.1 AbrB family looped-hinge helix DNA binding protein [Rhizobium pisi]RSB67094.1 AbrB/MazE/SpoVT family DNA-binding domain-containing protein [Rhizobium pisi]TCA53844.1 AbrB/MazE/SpoVT family DNA-binding domain-containing protein [Rhizobium pisi]
MRVTEKGQVTIPKDIRDRLKIGPGSEVDFVADEKGARLVVLSKAEPSPDDFESWLGSMSGTLDTGGMTTDEFMEWLRGPRDDLGPH